MDRSIGCSKLISLLNLYRMKDWSRRAPAIRIPSSGNDSDTGQAAAERVRVNISWSTADVSGNATMSNVTGKNASEGGGHDMYLTGDGGVQVGKEAPSL